MELNTENELDTDEGIINKIPISINISNKFLSESKSCLKKHCRKNSIVINRLNIPNKLSEKDFDNDILNNTVRYDKYKYNIKSEDSNSTTSKSSINDKFKKVTFSTVEIIRVANYKKYNKLNTIKKNVNNYSWLTEQNCFIF